MRLDDILSRRTKKTFALESPILDPTIGKLINLWREKLVDILSKDEVHRQNLRDSNKTVDDILAVFDGKIREGLHPGNAFYAGMLAMGYAKGSRAEELSLMNWDLITDLARKELASYGHPPENIDALIVNRFGETLGHSYTWGGYKDWSEEYVVYRWGNFASPRHEPARRREFVDSMRFLDKALAVASRHSEIPGINEFVEGLFQRLPPETLRGDLEDLIIAFGRGWGGEKQEDGSILYSPWIPARGVLFRIAGSTIRVFPDGTYKITYASYF